MHSMFSNILTSFILVLLLHFSLHLRTVVSCDPSDHAALLSFYRHLSSPPPQPLNWSSDDDCCQWGGIVCNHGVGGVRVTLLSLPGVGLSGTIPPSLSNLTFLSFLNLSGNLLSGSLPPLFFHRLVRLQTIDLSSNRLSGSLNSSSDHALPASIRTVDLSDNRFTGSVDPSFIGSAPNLVSFNVSNNTFSGSISFSSFCKGSPLLQVLDFSANEFTGELSEGIAGCSNLQVFRAGFNRLSGWLPGDLYSVRTLKEISLPNNHFSGTINRSIVLLSNLTILELQVNTLTGEIPRDIGQLSRLEQLQLHTNSLNGSLPPSLTDCSGLTTLLLRNNHFDGEISTLDFSKLGRLQTVDLGNNSFVGPIPASICLCRSLSAVRLAYNKLVGELPPCMASLRSLEHLSLSDNYLSNVVGALKILKNCRNLAVLFLSRCFHNETMPDDSDLLNLNGFQNLQIFTLGGCLLEGRIPSWIAKLKNLKVLNLSYNRIIGPIPAWMGDMPSLFVLNLTQNYLSGELPHELGRLPALITDNMSSDLSYLALPFLFDSLQYNRLFNLPRGLKVGYNNLSGRIPPEIGQLKLLHLLDLNDNNFSGSIPPQLSGLTNLERLDLSGNHLSGEIPGSLAGLHFLSSFNVANNDLEGDIPREGQFDTFPATSFEGNPKLCGYLLHRSCPVTTGNATEPEHRGNSWHSWWRNVPFGTGYFIGIFAVSLALLLHCSRRSSGGGDIVYSDYMETRSL